MYSKSHQLGDSRDLAEKQRKSKDNEDFQNGIGFYSVAHTVPLQQLEEEYRSGPQTLAGYAPADPHPIHRHTAVTGRICPRLAP